MISYAEDLLTAQLEDKVICFFPTTLACDAKVTTDRVVSQIQRLKATRQCEALPVTFTKELNTIIGTLTDLGKGVSPDSKHVGKFSSFHKRALKAAENWCTANVVSAGGKSAKSQVLFGKLAIEWMYETTLAKFESGNIALPDEMRDLRAFQWMLSREQEIMVSEWFKQAVRLLRSRQGSQCIKDSASGALLDIDLIKAAPKDPAVTIVSTSASSSDPKGSAESWGKSEGISQVLAPYAKAKHAMKAKTAAHASSDPKAAMASLFGGKAVVKKK